MSRTTLDELLASDDPVFRAAALHRLAVAAGTLPPPPVAPTPSGPELVPLWLSVQATRCAWRRRSEGCGCASCPVAPAGLADAHHCVGCTRARLRALPSPERSSP